MGRCPRLVLPPRWGSSQYAVNLDDLSPERGGPNEPGAVPVAFGQPPQAARHVLDRGGRGVQSPADRPEEGGVFGRERLHPKRAENGGEQRWPNSLTSARIVNYGPLYGVGR
jgi:hypothetical protein